MKECIDEGTLQTYFDGELEGQAAAAVASHLASCLSCAETARTVENENIFLSSALTLEFAEGVPTERLRQRVEMAMSENQIARPVRSNSSAEAGWWQSLREQLFPSPQRVLGYASLAVVIILTAIFGVVYLRRGEVVPVAEKQPDTPVSKPTATQSPAIVNAGTPVETPGSPPKRVVQPRPSGRTAARSGLLPGERNYVKRIAALKKSLKSDSPMRPSLQVEYEYNVALLDSAIEMTREAVKKNPKDTQAAQFMHAAYQSKVDLMSQVADARHFNSGYK
jgi:hypothetical protein